jgi:hypothetical protein
MRSKKHNETHFYNELFTLFSPCTGSLINKINNVHIVRNLHLFREYTQQFTASPTKKPFSQGETNHLPLSQAKGI